MKEPMLIVMAAGLGSRYGGLKQMESVTDAGEIILDFAVYDAIEAGFNKVLFIIKSEMEDLFKKKVIESVRSRIDAEYAIQDIHDIPFGYNVPVGRIKPWGTCHAVMAAKHLIDGPFAVINADDYYGKDAFVSVRDFLIQEKNEDKNCMVSYLIENTLSDNGTVTRGICKTDCNSNLMEIEETKNIGRGDDGKIYAYGAEDKLIKKGTPVSMNFWGFQKSFLDTIVEGFPKFLDKAVENNPMEAEYLLPIEVGKLLDTNDINVKVLKSEDKWYGITYKQDMDKVHSAFENMKTEGKYPDKLWK